jgi:hypothetical protein
MSIATLFVTSLMVSMQAQLVFFLDLAAWPEERPRLAPLFRNMWSVRQVSIGNADQTEATADCSRGFLFGQ